MGRVRFYMCGEYGEKNFRPHFHALLFGVDFHDKVPFSESGSGQTLYISHKLSGLWGLGHCLIGNVTFESAAYVSRYVMKKVTGSKADAHYTRVLESTGEVVKVLPEFTRMSLKPGIGFEWIRKFHHEVYVQDKVHVHERGSKPPKYYDKYLEKIDPALLEDIQYKRYLDAIERSHDNTTARLSVRENVARARLKTKVRQL